MNQGTHAARSTKVALAVGYGAFLLGVLAAHEAPATGYELSVYAATPSTYWLGTAVAVGTGLVVAFALADGGLLRDAGLLLGGLGVTSVIALPLIRGYYLFGRGDALTHLGWTRDLASGRLDPAGLLYPGVHSATLFVGRVLGIRFGRAQMLVVLAFAVAFVVFTVLCVRVLDRRAWAVPVGLFAGLLFLPVNDVSVHLMAHPVTQSLLLLPLVLYLTFRFVLGARDSRGRRSGAVATGALLSLAAVAVILVHPQGGLNVILVFLAVLGVQLFVRWRGVESAAAAHRTLAGPTAVAVAAFALWAPRHERVRSTAAGVTESLLAGSAPGDEIAQRSASLAELGGGVGTLFVKLFLVAGVFSALTALLAVAWRRGALGDPDGDRHALLGYGFASLVPLGAAFALFFVASMTTQHFRYVGFLMVPVTLLGAVALSEGIARLIERFRGRDATAAVEGPSGRVVLAVCFLLLLPLPVATLHASPFVYQPTQDVSEQQFAGATATFEQMDRSVPFAGIRSGPGRFVDAAYGTEGARNASFRGLGPDGVVPGPVFERNLTTHYEGARYLPVSRADYEREVGLYEGFRYSERGFERLGSTRGIDRVYGNGEYRLYLVNADGEE